MTLIRPTLIVLLSLSLAACAGMRPTPPEVQLSALEITDVSLSHANFLATLKLYNPNSFGVDVEGLNFTLFLNDIRVADGQTARTFTLPAEGSGEAAIRLSSSFFELFQLTRNLQGHDELTFRIAGELDLGGFGLSGVTIPIEKEGTLPLTGTLQQLLPGAQALSPLESFGNKILKQ